MRAWLGRRDRVDAAFAISAVVAAALITRLGLGLTFFADEWAFITSRSLTDPGTWFTPHNEHWSTLPIIVYRLLVETVGLGSYVPYLAVVTALHVVVASLVYILVRWRSSPMVGFGAGLMVLFLGSGFENLYWGFQIGFLGSMAAGLGAMAVLYGPPSVRKSIAGVALLVVGLMCSGVGVTFILVVGVELLLDDRRRSLTPLMAIPTAVFVAWYAVIGRNGLQTFAFVRSPLSAKAWEDAAPTVVAGIGNAAGAVGGVGPAIGLWVGMAAVAAVLLWIASDPHGPGTARFLGCLAGIVLQYTLIGVLRGGLVTDVTNYTRYTYVSAVLLIVGASALIPRTAGWRPARRRRLALLGGGSLLALSLVWNVRLLSDGRDLFGERAAMTRALVTVGLERPLPAGVDPDRSLVLVPSPTELGRIVARYGSPLGDLLAPGAVEPIPPDVAREALRRLIEGAPIPLPEDAGSP